MLYSTVYWRVELQYNMLAQRIHYIKATQCRNAKQGINRHRLKETQNKTKKTERTNAHTTTYAAPEWKRKRERKRSRKKRQVSSIYKLLQDKYVCAVTHINKVFFSVSLTSIAALCRLLSVLLPLRFWLKQEHWNPNDWILLILWLFSGLFCKYRLYLFHFLHPNQIHYRKIIHIKCPLSTNTMAISVRFVCLVSFHFEYICRTWNSKCIDTHSLQPCVSQSVAFCITSANANVLVKRIDFYRQHATNALHCTHLLISFTSFVQPPIFLFLTHCSRERWATWAKNVCV